MANVEWNERAKLYQFQLELNDEVKNVLAHIKNPTSLGAFIDLVQSIGSLHCVNRKRKGEVAQHPHACSPHQVL